MLWGKGDSGVLLKLFNLLKSGWQSKDLQKYVVKMSIPEQRGKKIQGTFAKSPSQEANYNGVFTLKR